MKNLSFILHVFFLLLAWFAPFLFSWKILVPVYAGVVLQFLIFKRCLMNESHDLDDSEDETLYSQLLERMGFRPDRKILKRLVRVYLYPVMILFTLYWQVYMGKDSLLF